MARTNVISQHAQHLKLPSLYFLELPGFRRRSSQDLSVNSPEKSSPSTLFVQKEHHQITD